MPVWFYYLAEYVMAFALLIISLVGLACVFGKVHVVAVDDEVCGEVVTYYLVVTGSDRDARLAAVAWLGDREQRKDNAIKQLARELREEEAEYEEAERHG